jgi:hypothetical protein
MQPSRRGNHGILNNPPPTTTQPTRHGTPQTLAPRTFSGAPAAPMCLASRCRRRPHQPDVPQPKDENPHIDPRTPSDDPPAAVPAPPTVNNHRQALQGLPLNSSTPTVAPVNDMAAQNAAYGGLIASMGAMRNGDLSGVPAEDIGYAAECSTTTDTERCLATAS